MAKINYTDFGKRDLVSKYKYRLALNKDQFDGLPSGALTLINVKQQLVDQEAGNTYENTKRVKLVAKQSETIEQVQSLKGLSEEVKDQLVANIPTVELSVDFHDGNGQLVDTAEVCKANWDWFSSHGLFDRDLNRVLTDYEYIVTWVYGDAYGNVLSLKILDISHAKISD